MTSGADGYSMELESSSLEKQQIADAGQGHISLYSSAPSGHQAWTLTAGSAAVQWNSYRTDNGPIENGIPSMSSYHDDQQIKSAASFQDGANATSRNSSVSSMGVSNASNDYSAYFSNQNSADPYAYAYQGPYYGYQQSSNDSSHQQLGPVQNTGAPYQPLSSFQNASSYVGPTSYSSTYYNPGEYQTTAGYQTTTAGYQSSDYNHQANLWGGGNYAHAHYSMYMSSDASAGQGSSADASHYQQQYTQWAGYYSQTTSAVICPPGTEHVPRTSMSAECPAPDFNGGYSMLNSQPPPPGTTSWRRDSTSSQGTNDVAGYSEKNGWQSGSFVFATNQASQVPIHFQKPLDSTPLSCARVEDQQNTVYTHPSNAQFPSTNLVPQNYQTPSQAVSILDTLRVSKMQIPTNPRIASNLSVPKTDKESSTADAVPRPAYISVPLLKPSHKVSSHDSAEGIMKGTFPPSLRAYVERSFARCKDDAQRVSNQNMMKEIITKASADGTLFTRDWDTEPLFPLPSTSMDAVNKEDLLFDSSIHKLKRSPSRRTKSRWEPVAEEKMVEKSAHANHVLTEDVSFNHFKVTEKSAVAKYENKVNGWSGMKFLQSQQIAANKAIQRPAKKQRFGDSGATENGDGSSDSDKEQGLTKYYSSAIAMANSPEERKRREHRYKRFEKGQERQGELKSYQPKAFRAGSLYNRRANATLLSKYDDGSSQAVEDIDWDSFTVKGTCQEIEKRYLRLTSAPDPATVRPEEVLEKALTMVQSSSKNYLYKCDQLKSIRQDLTVQRIHNELTVKVYETHARLALEAGDMPEYNQCQSQLKSLYAEGIKGCHFEFSAYNLLCVILHSSNNRELLSSMARLSAEAKKDEAVKHALAVRSAVTSGNYVLFFRLYKKAPNLNTCLMDLYIEKMRFEAVKCMSKSYRPTVPITFIAQVLGFFRAVPTEESEGKESDSLEDCEEWLRAHGAIVTVDNNGESQLDAKATSSSLYMPEPEDAVAHGDSSLAVDDFWTRAP